MLPVTSVLPPTGALMPGGHAVRDGPRTETRSAHPERAPTRDADEPVRNESHVLRLLRATAEVFAEILQFEAAQDPRHIGRIIDAYA